MPPVFSAGMFRNETLSLTSHLVTLRCSHRGKAATCLSLPFCSLICKTMRHFPASFRGGTSGFFSFSFYHCKLMDLHGGGSKHTKYVDFFFRWSVDPSLASFTACKGRAGIGTVIGGKRHSKILNESGLTINITPERPEAIAVLE